MKKFKRAIISLSLVITLTLAVGCSPREETLPDIENNNSISDELTQSQDSGTTDSSATTITATEETSVTVSAVESDTTVSAETSISETTTKPSTGNGTNLPTVTSTQTTKPVTTTTQSSNSPATTNRPVYTTPTTASHTHSYVIIGMEYSSTSSNIETTITLITTYACVCGDWYQVTDTETYGNDEVPVTTTPVMAATSIVTTQPTATNPAPAVTTVSTTTGTTTSKPAVTTASTTTGTTAPKPVVTTTTTKAAPSVTTIPAPAVTTTTAATTTPKPAVTTTPKPAVTTQPTPSHVHNYTSKVTKEATCTTNGTKTYTCSCGDKYTETIPATGHNWKNETVHHDDVTGKRDISEVWIHTVAYGKYHIEDDGIAIGLNRDTFKNEAIELGLTDLYNAIVNKRIGTYAQLAAVDPLFAARLKAYANDKGCGNNNSCRGHFFVTLYDYRYNEANINDIEILYSYSTGSGSFNSDIYAIERSKTPPYTNDRPLYIAQNYDSSPIESEYDIAIKTESYIVTPAYNETVKKCTACGITDHTHNYTSVVTKKPTCTEFGVKTYTCSDCSTSYTENIPPSHTSPGSGSIYNDKYYFIECKVCGLHYLSKSLR